MSTVVTKGNPQDFFLQQSEIPNKGRFDISCSNHITGYSHHPTRYGIKFVLSGSESYEVNHHEYCVNSGTYLLVNKDQYHEFEVKQQQPSKALCIGIDEMLLQDVYYTLTSSDHQLLEQPDSVTGSELEFLEMVYTTGNNSLGQYLMNVKAGIYKNRESLPIPEEELYYSTAYHLILSQTPLLKQMSRLPARKKGTSQELYKRLYHAKAIIDDYCLQPLPIEALCKEVALSEFHFYRSFKKAFGLSPHQYYLQQKLEKAKQLLLSHQHNITDVALHCGFADLPSFRKAFKKAFAYSPLSFIKQAGLNN
ncbi:MAG TPA: AraC family transcriptional regulator [Flavisolibacter sp.]|nr:AraC family transcriptional regulator [Flavisolibacter sp.]